MGVSNKELKIMMTMRNMATKELTRAQGKIRQFTKKSKADFVGLAAKVYLAEKAFRILGAAVDGVVSPLIETNSKVEDYQTQLEVLLKSEEKASQVFADMADFAGEVPKTYDEIMQSATALSGVVKDGTREINQLMPIIVDIASAKGMAVEDVTSQIIRMYSAGAAAADMFRERGITAALGFKQGVSYSAKETMDILISQWEDGTGKFVGASDKLAKNFTGMVSMFQDVWFQFKQQIGEPMFEDLKLDMQAVLTLIKQTKNQGGQYDDVVQNLSEAMRDAYDISKDLFGFSIVAAAQLVDMVNEVSFHMNRNVIIWGTVYKKILEANLAKNKFFKQWSAVDENIAELKALSGWMEELKNKNNDLAGKSAEDWSQAVAQQVDDFRASIEEQKRIIADAQEDRKESEVQASQEISDQKMEIAEAEKESYLQKEDEKLEELREKWQIWQQEKNAIELSGYEAQKEQFEFFIDTQQKAYQSLWTVAGQARDTFTSGMSKALGNLITQSGSAKKAFASMGQQMVQILIDWGVQRAVNFALSKAFMAAEVQAAKAAGAATANAWADAAAMVSLATMGANALPASAGIVSTVGIAHAIALPELADGGIVKAANGGRIVRVAEGGQDEAVIPLERGRNRLDRLMGPGAGGSTVVIEKIVINGNADEKNVKDLADEIGEVFKREQNYIRSVA